MRTSGEKARILDEAEPVQSVSYSHISIVRVVYSGVFKGRQTRPLPRAPLCNCNVESPLFSKGPNSVRYFTFKEVPNSSCNVQIPCFQWGPK